LTFNKQKSACQTLSVEVPEHYESIQAQLQTGHDKLNQLKKLVEDKKSRLEGAKEFFELVEKAEALLKDSNRSLIYWSSKFSHSEAENIKNDIEQVVNLFLNAQSKLLLF